MRRLVELLLEGLSIVGRLPVWIDGVIVVVIALAAWWKRPRGEVRYWEGELLRQFEGKVKLYGRYRREPMITVQGSVELSETLQEKSRHMREDIEKAGRENQTHLVLDGRVNDWKSNPIVLPPINFKDDPIRLEARTLSYAAIRTLRGDGCCLPLLSSNAVLVCSALQMVIVQRRSQWVDTEKGNLHTIGGSYKHGAVGDGLRLSKTLEREVREETQNIVAVSLNPTPPMLLLGETSSGFIQLVFLGVDVPKAQMEKLKLRIEEGGADHEEGGARIVYFSELAKELGKDAWTPTGKFAVLAWLAIGAPNAGFRPRFGGKRPQELFSELIES